MRPGMRPTEYACVFAHPTRERLVAAERLARALPSFLDGVPSECDLLHASASRFLAIVLRVGGGAFPAAVLARVAFWTARTGGSGFAPADLTDEGRLRFLAALKLCDSVARGIPTAHLPEALAKVLRALGSPPPAKGPPVLAVDLAGPGREALLYRPERNELVVASVLAPPVGDALSLLVRARGRPQPVEGWAEVAEAVARADATPARPAGFTLRIEGPPALHDLLAAQVPAATAGERRAAPRIAVHAPVRVRAEGSPPARPVATPPPHARIEYATDRELAADWIENLSHGGAFVRTSSPHPEGTKLVLDLTLPDGVSLSAQAQVTSTGPRGVGVRFVLTPGQDAVLAAAMARISARPRRALVVDDVALIRQMLADALVARGFEVIVAGDAREGIQRLSEELMALDLLVTDLRMPGMSGEELVRFIRKTGGESDLTIVAVTGRMEAGTEAQLLAAGADAVLDKATGPEGIADAADAALERKRS